MDEGKGMNQSGRDHVDGELRRIVQELPADSVALLLAFARFLHAGLHSRAVPPGDEARPSNTHLPVRTAVVAPERSRIYQFARLLLLILPLVGLGVGFWLSSEL